MSDGVPDGKTYGWTCPICGQNIYTRGHVEHYEQVRPRVRQNAIEHLKDHSNFRILWHQIKELIPGVKT